MQKLGLARLGILVGLLYWPTESLIHAFVFSEGSFLDNLIYPDIHELWMRLLITVVFVGFGWYAHQTIKEQQQLQDEIQKRGERLQQIIDCSYDAYVSMDENGIVTGWNRSAEILFGWSMHRIIGQNIEVIIPEHLREDHHKGMEHYKKTSIGPWLYKPIRTQALHRDGFEFPVEMVVTPLKSDGAQEFFAFMREQEQ